MITSVRQNIFDGYYEKELFKHLDSIWKKLFNIYPQLPFTKIFNIEKIDTTPQEKDFLLKTNIDYTICDKNDKPLICVEFDGLSKGYNKGAQYVQINPDPSRKKKMDLKLKIADKLNFPFYIVSYDEKEYLIEKIYLTILDGIIGQTIAKIKFEEKIKELLADSSELLNSLTEYDKQDFIQDIVLQAEVELELTYDPIAKKAAELEGILLQHKIINGYSTMFLSKPELPEIKDTLDFKGLEKCIKAWNDIKWYGCRVSVNTPKGVVCREAWMRNFECKFISPLSIVQNISELLAFYSAAIVHEIKV